MTMTWPLVGSIHGFGRVGSKNFRVRMGWVELGWVIGVILRDQGGPDPPHFGVGMDPTSSTPRASPHYSDQSYTIGLSFSNAHIWRLNMRRLSPLTRTFSASDTFYLLNSVIYVTYTLHTKVEDTESIRCVCRASIITSDSYLYSWTPRWLSDRELCDVEWRFIV